MQAKQFFLLIFLVLLFSVVVNILMLTGPLFMLQVYDRVLSSKSEETLFALLILVTAMFSFMGILDFVRMRLLVRGCGRFQSEIASSVFQSELPFKSKYGPHSAPKSHIEDFEAFQTATSSPALTALFDLIWLPIFLGAIFVLHPLLGWIAMAGAGVLLLSTVLYNRLTSQSSAQARAANEHARELINKIRRSGDFVCAQAISSAFQDRWLKSSYGSLKLKGAVSDWATLFTAFSRSFRMYLQSAILAGGAWLVIKEDLTAGGMIASSILLGRALAPIDQGVSHLAMIRKVLKAIQPLVKIRDETQSSGQFPTLPRPAARLSLLAVTVVAPGSHHPILRNVSLEIEPGSVVGVVGKSGSGKSTLAKAVIGSVKSTVGELRLGSAYVSQYAPEDLGTHIGYLPQQAVLFDGTIAENIARMSVEPDEMRVIKAAKLAGVHDFILRLPHGYQTYLEGENSPLSGGTMRLIGLATALYADPVLLVLDEPNSQLDVEGSAAVLQVIRDFRSKGKAVLILSQKPSAISECDTLAILEDGRITSHGPRDQIVQERFLNSHEVRQSFLYGSAS